MLTTVRPGLLRTLTLAVAATVLAACGGDDSASGELTTAKIGVLPIVEVAPVYLGIEKGFYADEGIDLKPELAQGGAVIVPAVVNKQYAFGFSNVVSLMLATDKGLPISMIAASSRTTGKTGADLSAVVVKGDSPIQSPADLEGRTVSVNTLKNIGDVTIKAAMEKNGADGTKIKFLEMALPDMQGQLEQGRIDAAWVVEPFLSAILGSGGRAVLWNYADADPNLIIAGYFTSEQMRQQDPDLVDGFARATAKSMDFARDNPDEVKRILTTYTELTAEQTKGLVLPVYEDDMDRDVLRHTADLMEKYGLTDEAPDVSALIGEQ